MKKNIFIVITFFLYSCSGCDEKKDSNKGFKTLLDREYDYVFGLIVPDSVRLAPTEVFVGRLLDKIPPGDSLISGNLADTFMLVQVRRFQNTYIAAMEYRDDAEVKIISDLQTVDLICVGRGTYRDVNNILHVEPSKTYRLEVRRPGRYYSDEVTVPGNFQVVSLSANDTVVAYPKKDILSSEYCYSHYPIITTKASKAFLYRHQNFNQNQLVSDPGPFRYASFMENNQAAFSPFNFDTVPGYIYFTWEIFAFDSSFSVFYQREGLGANQDVFDFLDYWDDQAHVTARSSLDGHGADDVIGNFGAYNALRFDFTVKGLKDSCFCTRFPPECP